MRIRWKKIVLWLALSLLLVFAWKIYCVRRGPAFEYRDAAKSLPVIQQFAEAGVKFYREQDWCQVLSDREGVYANTDRSTCAIVAETKDVKRLEGEALVRWKRWQEIARRLPYEAMWIVLSYEGPQGALSEAEIQLNTWGRESLVYSKGYKLPKDDPYEMVHTAIDGDWYHRWEDWN